MAVRVRRVVETVPQAADDIKQMMGTKRQQFPPPLFLCLSIFYAYQG